MLPDNRVQLSIRQFGSTLSLGGVNHSKGMNGVIDSQQAATTIAVPFGQWVTIGQVNQSQQGFATADSISCITNRTQTLPIQIKID